MKTKIRTLLTVLFFSCAFSFAYAQGDPGEDPDPSVPIDGGLSLLIAAGVGYAAKHRYDKKKKEHAGKDADNQD